ncbi:unnamed protein product [Didymodactylos carnosus]|uniref:kynurenine--oxoglutarate transaminase n=1 Tax=Didymodactylos carnosus TaxID=1234261 RepID=A0A8S2F695_9BILA|nr:unnamed protein product [Didymodactylos carnosus]CAF4148114.1 unnamed protein product [Didymodactylos carnosus]
MTAQESSATIPPQDTENEDDILAKRFKGQGFIDYAPPQYVIDSYRQTADDPNILLYQYTRGFGHRRLVNAIAQVYSKYFFRELDPLNQILVTSGAYPSLFNAINGFLNPGDEIIVFKRVHILQVMLVETL